MCFLLRNIDFQSDPPSVTTTLVTDPDDGQTSTTVSYNSPESKRSTGLDKQTTSIRGNYFSICFAAYSDFAIISSFQELQSTFIRTILSRNPCSTEFYLERNKRIDYNCKQNRPDFCKILK